MISEGNASTFNEWRDQQFSIVASQIIGESSGNIAKNWNDVRSFLGYAPVLGVMAEFLAVPNPSKSLSIADRTFAVSSDVLLSIVDTILIREQGKFLDSTLDKLQATTSVSETLPDSQQLYSPIEQTVRLIAKIHSSSLCRNGLVALPSSVSQDYEIAAGQFLADHPFIAGSTTVNAVFGDYLLAKAATDPVCQLALSPEGRLITSDPGPFFYAFLHHFASSSGAAQAVIDEALISRILSSRHKLAIESEPIEYTYVQTGEDAQLVVYGDAGVTYDYSIENSSGILELTGYVARGMVLSDGDVVLGDGGRVLVGPDAHVGCNELLINATRLSVTPAKGGRPSSLAAQVYVAPALRKIEAVDPKSLVVHGEPHWHALKAFTTRDIKRIEFLPYSNYMDLRAVLRSFRQGAGSSPSAFGELLDQRVAAHNRTRRHYIKAMLNFGILSQANSHYYLNVDTLGKRGISLDSISRGEPDGNIAKLVHDLNSWSS